MATWVWAVIGVAVALLLVTMVVTALARRRTRRLQERFGPEYDRTVEESGGTRAAQSELREREKRHDELDIRPLTPDEQELYRLAWRDVQARFVDDPSVAVGHADRLIMRVMDDRGYPVDDFEQRAADLSVEHPGVVEHYRAAHRLADEVHEGNGGTETLRQAMQHFRALFDELVEPAADAPTGRDTAADEQPATAETGETPTRR